MSREAMKHTPGPWRLCYDGQIDGSDGRRICAFDWNSYGEFRDSNNAANARLISASPELLALAERIAKLPEHSYYLALIDEARAAIAKATGDEQRSYADGARGAGE